MKVPIKGLGDVGWNPDQEAYELAPNAVSDLQNFRFHAGSAERVRGYRQVYGALSSAAYFVTGFTTGTNRYLIHCTHISVHVDEASTRYTITPSGGLTSIAANKWTAANLSGYVILNNGSDRPMSWDGNTSNVLTVLPGWSAGEYCKAIRATRYHLFAIAPNGNRFRIKWSAAAEPGSLPASWNVSDATIDAGQVDVTADAPLVDALPFGDSLVVYAERGRPFIVSYVGGNDVFSIQAMSDPVGMLAPNCGCVVPGIGHVVLGASDVVANTGQGARSILNGKARKWLLDSIDPDYATNSFVVAHNEKAEVWICIPEKGYQVCTKALVWNWETQALSKRDLPNVTSACAASFNYAASPYDTTSTLFDSGSASTTFASAAESLDTDKRIVMGATALKMYLMDSTDQADGASFTGYIERTGLSLDEPETRKHLKRMWIAADGDAGTQISVYFGSSNDPETAPTYESPVTFTIGTSQWVDAWTNGRFLAYKLSSTGYFRVRSIALEVEPGGMY